MRGLVIPGGPVKRMALEGCGQSNVWSGRMVDPGSILCARKHQSEVNDRELPTRGIVWFPSVHKLITQACFLSYPVALSIQGHSPFMVVCFLESHCFDAVSFYFLYAQELHNAAVIAGLQQAEHHWFITIPSRISAVYRNRFNQRKANITKVTAMLWWKPL